MKIMTSEQFMREALKAVYDMAVEGLDPTDFVVFKPEDVYWVTHSYILGNQKAMISTTLPDGKYYEVTYNSEKEEMYVDCYVRTNQKVIK